MTKPQLVMQDTAGRSNADLGLTITELDKNAAWKKQRIVVILPTAEMISAKVALTHWNLAFPPNNSVTRILAIGTEVGEAYSNAVEQILAHPELSKWEFILTLESDNMPPPWGVQKLLQDMEEHPEYDCIGGLYFLKGPIGSPAQIWGDVKDPVLNFRPQVPVPNSIQECNGTGMGFNLWRMGMFKELKKKKVPQPWFKTLKGGEGEGIATQDLYFWGMAKKYGFRCAIDTAIPVGHYDIESDTVY